MVRRFLEEGEHGLRPHLLTNSMDALKQYTRDRTGVSIFCSSAMWHEITAGQMTAVPLSGVSPVRQEMCSRRTTTNNRIIDAFRQEIDSTPPFKIAV